MQVETISTLESMLLGDPFDFLSTVPALLSALPSCSLVRQVKHDDCVNVFLIPNNPPPLTCIPNSK